MAKMVAYINAASRHQRSVMVADSIAGGQAAVA